jgi:transposase
MQKYITTKLLGFEDENIIFHKVSETDGLIYINLSLKRSFHKCPHCSTLTNKVHDYRVRKIKHAAYTGYKAIINYNRRRYVCTSCNHRFPEPCLFVNRFNKISNHTRNIILMEYASTQSFKAIANRLNVSSSTVIRHTDRCIAEFSMPLPEVLSIDEFKNHTTGPDKYSCILVDPINKKTIDILPNRKTVTLEYYFSKIPLEERKKVKFFITDMWAPYKQLAKKCFPNAVIVADTFHFVRHIYWAFNNTRVRNMKKFKVDSIEYKTLKKYWKLLIKNTNDISSDLSFNKYLNRLISPTGIVDYIANINDELASSIKLKDDFFEAVKTLSYEQFETFIEEYIERLRKCNIKEFKETITLFKNWKQEIKNSFIKYDHVDNKTGEVIEKKYSNAVIEGINNFVKVTKRVSYGYKNFTRFKKRIMHNFNKDYLLNN